MLITGYNNPLDLLKSELTQLDYEGYAIPEKANEAVKALDPEKDAFDEAKISKIAGMLGKLVKRADFNYVQPDDLEAIKRERPAGPRALKDSFDDSDLLDRLHGAWTGRAVGCALGKPVEGLGMRGQGDLNGRLSIKSHLEKLGHWPLDFYFSGADAGDGIKLGCERSFRENIVCMEPDDDIHYSLIGLKVLEEKGRDFTWRDVANAWNSSLPYNAICTAETQAILNYNMAVPRCLAFNKDKSLPVGPEFTRRNNNPFREWIGAQIRADGWAYSCAGNPELAAEFAWRDASWTHTANGIYGEMFVAAMIAAAFVESDPKRLVEIGLSEIPGNCRLAEDIRWALETIPSCKDFESFMEKSEIRFKGMSPVHTNNNAVIVVMSLFYGAMNPGKSICISVMGALDTDCNGATTGSIVGAASGFSNFKSKLVAPLNDCMEPQVFGFQKAKLSELAERSLKVYKAIKQRG